MRGMEEMLITTKQQLKEVLGERPQAIIVDGVIAYALGVFVDPDRTPLALPPPSEDPAHDLAFVRKTLRHASWHPKTIALLIRKVGIPQLAIILRHYTIEARPLDDAQLILRLR